MIRKFFQKRKIENLSFFVEPDEIFLDSHNPGGFDRQQFEGRIEKSISKGTLVGVMVFFIMVMLLFSARLGYLQIMRGEAYRERSERNVLESVIIFAERGIIYDRNHVELAWNEKEEGADFAARISRTPGFAHVLGYVSYPAKDEKGVYWQTEYEGKDGLEKEYNRTIRGQNGAKIVEVDAGKTVHSENIVNAPERGGELVTTIDSRVQEELFRLIANASSVSSYTGGAGVILDVRSGEVLAATSYPEYDPGILSEGKDKARIESYATDKRKVYLDRTISGLYTPGSIVKPFLALGALAENVIDPFKEILSTGSISVPNPYFPDKPSTFKDWRAHGWTDMREAIAVSSDVYFYTVGGGYEGQKGLGILNIEKYIRMFGIGEATGVDLPDEKGGTVPSPEWKLRTFGGDPWRVGDTYNTAIGQYGFQVTPMEMARAVAAIANRGVLIQPHFLLGKENNSRSTLSFPDNYFQVVHEGMRGAATYGTASILNVPYVEVAAKTGTAQLGAAKNRINSWVIGFFPYRDPKYAFAIIMESGPTTAAGASGVARGLFDWMNGNAPEYFQ